MSQARFSIVPIAAVSDSSLSATQLRVLLAIGSFLSKDNEAYPKQQTIANMIDVRRETVNRAIKVLKERKYIEVRKQKRDDGGRRENAYFVPLDPCDLEITAPVTCDPSVTPPVTVRDHSPCDRTASQQERPIGTPSNSDELDLDAQAPEPDVPDLPSKPKRKPAPRGAARGSQINPNWSPAPNDYAHASKTRSMTPQEINHEADQFRDYHLARGTVSKDWSASWRTWCGNHVKFKQQRSGGGGRGHAQGDTSFAGVAARMEGYAPAANHQPRPERYATESEHLTLEQDGSDWRSVSGG